MREIGVREFKSGLSEVLREVDSGARVRITVRGRPVADLVPASTVGRDRGLDELVAQGRVTPASVAHAVKVPMPIAAAESASDAVIADRDLER